MMDPVGDWDGRVGDGRMEGVRVVLWCVVADCTQSESW